MENYLKTVYFQEEYGKKDYPQKLCNYIYCRFFKPYIANNNIVEPELLDIGSGKGNHLLGFSRNGINVHGLDKRKECINILKDFDIRECDIEKEKFPYKDNQFDFIFSKSVLEHVKNIDNFLKESLRVIKPGGIVVFMTPDWQSQMYHFWDDYTHVTAFTRKSLQNALKINRFHNVYCEYFLQLPFIWKYPSAIFLTKIISLLPNSWKWKDKEESKHNKLIRFSKEKMLLAYGIKK